MHYVTRIDFADYGSEWDCHIIKFGETRAKMAEIGKTLTFWCHKLKSNCLGSTLMVQ